RAVLSGRPTGRKASAVARLALSRHRPCPSRMHLLRVGVWVGLGVGVIGLGQVEALFPSAARRPVAWRPCPEAGLPAGFGDAQRVDLGLPVAVTADEPLVVDAEVAHVVTVLADLLR